MDTSLLDLGSATSKEDSKNSQAGYGYMYHKIETKIHDDVKQFLKQPKAIG